jgi:hypothetical protein
MFCTPLITMQSLGGFSAPMIDLLTLGVLSTQSSKLVKAGTSALFNLSKLSFEEVNPIGEDELTAIIVALVEALKNLEDVKGKEGGELERLLTVCVGGYIILGKQYEGIKDILTGIDVLDVLKGVGTTIAEEVIELIQEL